MVKMRLAALAVISASALALAEDIPWTCRLENHPADIVGTADGAFAASASAFESVASVSRQSPESPLDSVATLRRVTPGINLDTDKRAGAFLIIR